MPLLNTIVRGNVNGPTVVLIHGWPDTDAVFEAQYEAFADKYRLVCVQLPLYTKECRPTSNPGFLGYTLDEVRDMFIETVKKESPQSPPLLIAHDWGAIVSYLALAKEPTLVRKMVALDIGQHSKPTFKGMLILLAYQWSLIWCYLMPSFLGSPLTRLVAKVFHAPHPEAAHSGMNYLYCQVWKLLLTGNAKSLRAWNPPKVPILYLYGQHKPLFFHSQRWLDYVAQLPGSKVRSLPGGHWFFTKKSKQEANSEIAAFLAN